MLNTVLGAVNGFFAIACIAWAIVAGGNGDFLGVVMGIALGALNFYCLDDNIHHADRDLKLLIETLGKHGQ